MKAIIEKKDIIDFIKLQEKLSRFFFESYPKVKDFNWLLDFPKRGKIKIGDESWDFVKHGKGIRFTRITPEPTVIVDINNYINNPRVIDVWRLLEYFERDSIEFEKEYIQGVLDKMVDYGELKKIYKYEYELL
ncbi:hypothetical protein FE392_11035 [Xenorhabdus sp. 12]|uniref:DUF6896 domain-containing protein n=1 Tax=Xenorhabdus santafensis TaxID=2582833 RepID=A0ABU4SAN6_9GAMM|nr:hypothetical protein [Xenorhabdus sp. 12]MDX7987859.1 hypothetical protein [Xenorhabdus sp. 12]